MKSSVALLVGNHMLCAMIMRTLIAVASTVGNARLCFRDSLR